LWLERKTVRPQEFTLHQRIEAAGGLVEHQQRLPAHECGHDPDLLAVASREAPNAHPGVELEALRERRPCPARESPEPAEVLELLRARELAKKARVGPEVADLRTRGS
jgi:hypothetical protein